MELQNLESGSVDSTLQFEMNDPKLDRGRTAAGNNKWLFEISDEVAIRVGGTYTVMTTKSAVEVEEWGDQYCLLGWYNAAHARNDIEFLDQVSLPYRRIVALMRDAGVTVYVGRWLVKGNAQLILFDPRSAVARKDGFMQELWDVAHIRVPSDDRRVNDAVVFGGLVAWFLEEFIHGTPGHPQVTAHFHKWSASIGLLFLRSRQIPAAYVFTTHTNVLGRVLCTAKEDFYNKLDQFDVYKEAEDRQIYHRYCLERAVVRSCPVFTSVSDIDGLHAQHLHGRQPDVVTPNGLNVVKFSSPHEIQNIHSTNKNKIHDFIRGHFCGHLDFDLDKTLYFFTAGRNEIHNKGTDLVIEALAKLNQHLQSSRPEVTIVAFVIIPTKTNGFNQNSLCGQAVAKQLREIIQEAQNQISSRIFDTCVRGKCPSGSEFLEDENAVRLKRGILEAKRLDSPSICTHNVLNDTGDPILEQLRMCNLLNRTEDRVKVVFHPEFLSSASPVLAMEYEDLVRGCHLGVFPSFYEPWGYTPAECTIMGVPSITTNLSGFGCFMQEHVLDLKSQGIYIVDRRFQTREESTEEITQYMIDFLGLSQRQRIDLRDRSEKLGDLLDWKNLIKYYRQARRLAEANACAERADETERSGNDTKTTVIPPTSTHVSSHPSPVSSGGNDTDESLALREKPMLPISSTHTNLPVAMCQV